MNAVTINRYRQHADAERNLDGLRALLSAPGALHQHRHGSDDQGLWKTQVNQADQYE